MTNMLTATESGLFYPETRGRCASTNGPQSFLRSSTNTIAVKTWLRTSIALFAVLVSACSPGEGPAGVFVTNDLDMTVRMTYVVGGAEKALSDDVQGDVIRPGEKKL